MAMEQKPFKLRSQNEDGSNPSFKAMGAVDAPTKHYSISRGSHDHPHSGLNAMEETPNKKMHNSPANAMEESPNKQKQKFDETEVHGDDYAGKTTTRYITKEDGDDYKSKTYSVTDQDKLYKDGTRMATKTKSKRDDGDYKTKTTTYSKDKHGNITKSTYKRDGDSESKKTKTYDTFLGKIIPSIKMKIYSRKAKKYQTSADEDQYKSQHHLDTDVRP
tara:strand:- start:643 stop:1296 length:654 start_codon:yes stop_codon:yes gene_type:complete